MSNRNEGYIEIKNGSIWKKVAEENWDENRQKMLCQYLGFEEIDGNNIETTQLGSGQEIVTGDLICYNTQSNRTSCCVHLNPLTTNTSTAIPDVRCKYALLAAAEGKLLKGVVHLLTWADIQLCDYRYYKIKHNPRQKGQII